MNKAPTVSVLMALYNREDYVSEAIESVLNSSYTDFELIIVDDGSSDASYHIAKSWASKDDRIRLFQNEKNLGQFPNRNKAAEYARGKYIKYLDSDDKLFPRGLELMLATLEKVPKASFLLPAKKAMPQDHGHLVSGKSALKAHFMGAQGGSHFYSGPSAQMYLRDAFWSVGGFPKLNYVGNDGVLQLLLAAQFDFVCSQIPLVFWREHDGQAVKEEHGANGYLLNEAAVHRVLLQYFKGLFSSEEFKFVQKKQRNYCLGKTLQLLKRGKPKLALRFYRSATTKNHPIGLEYGR